MDTTHIQSIEPMDSTLAPAVEPAVESRPTIDSTEALPEAVEKPREVTGKSVGSTVTVKGVARHKRKEISTNTLRRDEIRKVVATAQDPLRALPTLPGVSTASDLSVRPVVRGGDQIETGVQLDGVPLLMPYHFGSVFSVFHREAIEDFQLYSGVAPAQAQGMLSGTILARTRPAPLDTTFGGADISLLRGSAWVGVPLVKDVAGFWLSGQSLWYDWSVKRIMDLAVLAGAAEKAAVDEYKTTTTLPTTWDVQAGLSVKPGRDWLLDLGGFVAGDKYLALEQTKICLDDGREVPCGSGGYKCDSAHCWMEELESRKFIDTSGTVDFSNWMSRSRLTWSPDRDLSVEAVATYQAVKWSVDFPGSRKLVYDSAKALYFPVRRNNGDLFDWKRNALDLDFTARKRWNDRHETSVGLGWGQGETTVWTHLDRSVAELILGTTGNPMETRGLHKEEGLLVLNGPKSWDMSLDNLEEFDFNYHAQIQNSNLRGWSEHRWDPDGQTRVRMGGRLATSSDGSMEIPNPRIQVQRQITDDDLLGMGLALHTQSELPFEWRLAAAKPLESEKAWLGIVEWEHSFAPGWRSTVSAWGKIYRDLASPKIELDGIVDTQQLAMQKDNWIWQNFRRLGISDSTMQAFDNVSFSMDPYLNDPLLTEEENWVRQRAYYDSVGRANEVRFDSARRVNDVRRRALVPASVAQNYIWWMQGRKLGYASTGEGWATGLEVSLRYQPTEGWSGWASVEWSMSRRKDRDGGIWYPFGLERPWKFGWVNAFRIDKKWEVSARYSAMAGNPYTPFKVFEYDYTDTVQSDTTLWIGRRNSARFAPYQRLDLRLSRESTIFGKPATFYYEIWNAFNDPNFVLRDDRTGEFKSVSTNVPFPVMFLGCEVRF